MATSLKALVQEYEERGGLGDPTDWDLDRTTEDQSNWLDLMEETYGEARVGWDCQNFLIVTARAAAYVDVDGFVETANLVS